MITKEDIEAFQDDEAVDDITNDWHDDFETVEKPSVFDTDRWHTYYEMVAKHKESGTFWNISWQVGSTEYQECDFEPHIQQVYPHVVTTTVYKSTPQDESE